ncbi:MAG: PIN domain-containing protein [Calditrichaeota bacterium]|nr:MAG: PIN domain-containing protein [Calditrichota bacterium]
MRKTKKTLRAVIVLIDTDILIDVALERLPHADASAWFLDLAERRECQAFIAWHSIANFYYIVSSPSGKTKAKEFIRDLLTFTKVASVGTRDALYAVTLEIPDFEDALQIAAARACGAEKIITRNVKHYRQSPIPAQTPTDLRKQFN